MVLIGPKVGIDGGISSPSGNGISSVDSKVPAHWFTDAWSVDGSPGLNVKASELPCRLLPRSKNLSVDVGKFGPGEVGSVAIEGVLPVLGKGFWIVGKGEVDVGVGVGIGAQFWPCSISTLWGSWE